MFPWAEGSGPSWNFLVEPVVVPGLIVSASPSNLLGIQVIWQFAEVWDLPLHHYQCDAGSTKHMSGQANMAEPAEDLHLHSTSSADYGWPG